MSKQSRHKGRFERSSKIEWRENLRTSCERRKIQRIEKEKPPSPPYYGFEGQRIWTPQCIANSLWCTICDDALSLRFAINEKMVGLVSICTVRCHRCLKIYEIHSSKPLDERQDNYQSRNRYGVNMKAAAAMLDAGIGPSQTNTFLSEMNIPDINTGLLKRNERFVTASLKKLADESCAKAISLEKKLTILEKTQEGHSISVDDVTNITGSVDGAWAKRGAGHNYDSLSGQASTFGVKSRKCLARGVRNKQCRLCREGHPPENHNCEKNWAGSAKAMEPDIIAEMVGHNEEFKRQNVRISTLIGDDDCSTIAALRRECNHDVRKLSDLNHAAKKLRNELWLLKIGSANIEYLTDRFRYVLKLHKGDVEGVRKGILNIVPHAFDLHDNCGDWCQKKNNSGNHKHSRLPGEKGLGKLGESMRVKLLNIFERFAKHEEKLAPCGSTQINESFNASVVRKAPKALHFGGSESYSARVDASVLQINEGTSYVVDWNNNFGASPGTNTQKYRSKKDVMRKRRAEMIREPEKKKRRKQLKKNRTRQKACNTRKEGVTYSAQYAFDRIDEFVDRPVNRENPPSDIKYVYFDLETTGLNKAESQICQISAKHADQEFNAYIIPPKGIPAVVMELTELSIHDGDMYYRDEKVPTVTLRGALVQFLNFLRNVGPSISLVAHNGFSMDAPFIMRDMRLLGLWKEFSGVVYGFVDTLVLLKEKLAERKKAKLKFNQKDLTKDLLGDAAELGAHNAITDVRNLEKIVAAAQVTQKEMEGQTRSLNTFILKERIAVETKQNKQTLACLTDFVSSHMIHKIAGVGISLHQLQRAYQEKNQRGVELLLTEDVGGKVRVTQQKKIIQNVILGVQKSIENKENL